jgi:hypothetical protein
LRDREAVAPKPGLEEEADCISAGQARLEDIDGYDREDRQGEKEAQVQGTAPQPVPAVWPAARVSAQVRVVPVMFSEIGAPGRYRRCDQEQLVTDRAADTMTAAGPQENEKL